MSGGEFTQVAQRLLDQNPHTIVLDLRGLATVDASGARELLLVHLRASDQHAQLLLIRGSPSVQRVIDGLCGPFLYTDE